ncbi:MAG: hypothetical protein ACOC9R_01720 [bacterium]
MNTTLPPPCTVPWCAETGVHDRHQTTVGPWHGRAVTGATRTVTAELVVQGLRDPAPALVLIDTADPAHQLDCELDWAQLVALAFEALSWAGRVGQ